MSRHIGSSWPIRKTKRDTHMRSLRRRSSLTGKRHFGFAEGNSDLKVPSTEYIITEPVSPKATRIKLTPPPLAHQGSPVMMIKRKKQLPDIKVSTSSDIATSSSSVINNEDIVTSKSTDIQCSTNTMSHQNVSNVIRPETTNTQHSGQSQSSAVSIITNTCTTPDFLQYTSEDSDFGFQDVDLTINPSSISIFFEND